MHLLMLHPKGAGMSKAAESPLWLDRLVGAVGAPHVTSDGGRVRARPGSASEVADLLRVAREANVGAGVGTAPIGIDLSRMCNVLHLDETSLLVTVQAGLTIEALEEQLHDRGLEVPHLPPLSRHRTVGALLAAPRPSEASPATGRFTAACAGLSAVLADGTEIDTRVAPRKATGPDLVHALVGARGTLGVITAATLRIARRAELREEAAWALTTVEDALAAARALLCRGGRPTDLQVAVSPAPTLAVTVYGPRAVVEAERQLAHRTSIEHGGRPVPHTPPPLIPSAPEERAVPLESITRALGRNPSPSVRVLGWHLQGAAIVDPERAPGPTPPAHPLVAALKRRLDPDGRLPPWPGA
jgi:FAD/FMN-containing dehydrogenase